MSFLNIDWIARVRCHIKLVIKPVGVTSTLSTVKGLVFFTWQMTKRIQLFIEFLCYTHLSTTIFPHFHGNKGCRNTFLGILRFISQGYDIEGWHNALNRGAGSRCRLLFYSLIELLDREARITAISIRLVSDKKLKRIQRKKYRELQAKLFSQWELYANRQKTAVQLLKVCSQLNGPARVQ